MLHREETTWTKLRECTINSQYFYMTREENQAMKLEKYEWNKPIRCWHKWAILLNKGKLIKVFEKVVLCIYCICPCGHSRFTLCLPPPSSVTQQTDIYTFSQQRSLSSDFWMGSANRRSSGDQQIEGREVGVLMWWVPPAGVRAGSADIPLPLVTVCVRHHSPIITTHITAVPTPYSFWSLKSKGSDSLLLVISLICLTLICSFL